MGWHRERAPMDNRLVPIAQRRVQLLYILTVLCTLEEQYALYFDLSYNKSGEET